MNSPTLIRGYIAKGRERLSRATLLDEDAKLALSYAFAAIDALCLVTSGRAAATDSIEPREAGRQSGAKLADAVRAFLAGPSKKTYEALTAALARFERGED